MRAKSIILLVIALGSGMIAAVGVSKAVMDKNPTAVVDDSVEIFVAVKDLPHGQKISPESVKLQKWPKAQLPEGALVKLEQIENKYTNQMIFASEPILQRKVADSRESFSTAIPPGYRVFDIPGSAGYIKPGDHVDILGTFRVGGRSVAETRTVMRNVQVFGINGVTTRDVDSDNASRGTIFQLLVKESQLEALTLANSMSELRMNLRPFGEDTKESADNGESFLSWISEGESGKSKSSGSQQQVSTVASSVQNLVSGQPKAKYEMTIVTPAGIKTYHWNEPNEIPKEVPEQGSGSFGGMPTNDFAGTTGNVYSGYGGYSPTYPTSTTSAQPAGPPKAGSSASNGSTGDSNSTNGDSGSRTGKTAVQ